MFRNQFCHLLVKLNVASRHEASSTHDAAIDSDWVIYTSSPYTISSPSTISWMQFSTTSKATGISRPDSKVQRVRTMPTVSSYDPSVYRMILRLHGCLCITKSCRKAQLPYAVSESLVSTSALKTRTNADLPQTHYVSLSPCVKRCKCSDFERTVSFPKASADILLAATEQVNVKHIPHGEHALSNPMSEFCHCLTDCQKLMPKYNVVLTCWKHVADNFRSLCWVFGKCPYQVHDACSDSDSQLLQDTMSQHW